MRQSDRELAIRIIRGICNAVLAGTRAKDLALAGIRRLELRGLNAEHIAAMRLVVNGGDVFDRKQAELLRQVENTNPALIRIGRPQFEEDERKQRPYFGAMLTRRGRAAISKRWRVC